MTLVCVNSDTFDKAILCQQSPQTNLLHLLQSYRYSLSADNLNKFFFSKVNNFRYQLYSKWLISNTYRQCFAAVIWVVLVKGQVKPTTTFTETEPSPRFQKSLKFPCCSFITVKNFETWNKWKTKSRMKTGGWRNGMSWIGKWQREGGRWDSTPPNTPSFTTTYIILLR